MGNDLAKELFFTGSCTLKTNPVSCLSCKAAKLHKLSSYLRLIYSQNEPANISIPIYTMFNRFSVIFFPIDVRQISYFWNYMVASMFWIISPWNFSCLFIVTDYVINYMFFDVIILQASFANFSYFYCICIISTSHYFFYHRCIFM